MKLNIEDRKKFMLLVGVALGLLLLVLGYDSSIRQAAAVTRENNQNKGDELEDTKEKFVGLEGITGSTNEVLKKEFLPNMLAKLQFADTLPPAPEGEQAVHLRKELMRLQREAKNSAARKSILIPEKNWDIGDKIKQNNTPEEVQDMRLRLSATYSFVKKCIESNVGSIKKIQQKSEIIEAIENTTKVIRRLPFAVEFEGGLFSIASVLHEFQKEGHFLELMGCEIEGSVKSGSLRTKAEFAILRVLDRSEVTSETGRNLKNSGGKGNVPSRGRPRNRRY